MCWKSFVIIFVSYLAIVEANESPNCTLENHRKSRTFQSLVHYQANKLSFNPSAENYDGNNVSFTIPVIEQLRQNSFVTYSSENIIALDLSNKSIEQIDDGAFSNLICLHYLDLSNNKISNLTKDTFLGLENLRTLNISGNNLTYLYKGVFSNVKRIEVLDISYNKIRELDESVLDDIPALEKLMLSHNSMKRIRWYFIKLLHLKELYLDHNHIAIVYTAIFKENKVLEKLDLSGNGVAILTTVLPRQNSTVLPTVKNLNLSDNYLITLHVNDLLYTFPNKDLTIDFNDNQFYCISWKKYLKEFQEKHVKIAPGRNFDKEYYIDGIACDTLLSSYSKPEDTFDDEPKEINKWHRTDGQHETRNWTLHNIVEQLNRKESNGY